MTYITPLLTPRAKLVFAICAMVCQSAVAVPEKAEPAVEIVRGDEVVRVYHSLPGALPQDDLALARTLAQTRGDDLGNLAQAALVEKDAFKKRDLLSVMVRSSTPDHLPPLGTQVQVPSRVVWRQVAYVFPYDFARGTHTICLGEGCQFLNPPPLLQEFGAYELRLNALSRGSQRRLSFGVDEQTARKIEEEVAWPGADRRVRVRLFVDVVADAQQSKAGFKYAMRGNLRRIELVSSRGVKSEHDLWASPRVIHALDLPSPAQQ